MRQVAHHVRTLPGLGKLEPVWNTLHPAYDRVVRMVAERQLRTMPGGEDRWRFDGLYHDFPYESIEPHVYTWIARHAGSATKFYDIGAFIGYHTMCAAKRVDADNAVFAFEPEASNLRVLQHNLQLNKLSTRVRCFGVAVGSEDKKKASSVCFSGAVPPVMRICWASSTSRQPARSPAVRI